MNEARGDRLSVGLWCLLIYQGLLVLGGLFVIALYGYAIVADRSGSASGEVPVVVLVLLLLVGWVIALVYASVGMARRRSQGYLVGKICHLIIGILALVLLMIYGSVGGLAFLSSTNEAKAWASLILFFGLAWLPFVLISGWGFFYLRRLQQRTADPGRGGDEQG